ncbi:FepA family TonB-dependent siderophore receptor [Thauera linaloolentis]|uniref:Outer membrane receptor FepA n=1 Tax=Thauera linaloolentis (strain DSM 12138 / JCM 21573 / CCUG 41526 / CIP 105981 / IAM 15112 / NBRC 102519 / 47Lol) TaxID=1123367 RepID=N6YGR8_THAL4|nr:FepA family TonB-dependent siderophore receptor [Thauera linaloolentis]ENO90700.1 outer membrane receptor FepA [Thauera linaloolentis 47Lol = DSM 12138]MCM8565608.1 FepA family TonB-dependent siderophore receptor [Thauera linaloolentis]
MTHRIIRLPRLSRIALAVCALSAQLAHAQDNAKQLEEVVVTASAEEEAKRSLGVSILTAEDIEKQPPAADLSEVLRREPGVNLTGSASSGMRGNRRQIDLRGMGPDNTLVLIDGRPARSRNASRQGWTGERDTDGDTGWVPPEAIEKVEILRGPSAARYGSGAMGGVVNIITKRPTDKLAGSVTLYGNFQQDGDEGDTYRTTFNLAGPLGERLGFRLYGGYAKTEPDALGINAGYSHVQNGIPAAAGKTGNRNQYINGLLTLDIDSSQKLEMDLGYSRKSDLYSGDTQNMNGYETGGSAIFDSVADLHGKETTVVYRSSAGLTHRGNWDWGSSRVGLSYAETRNSRGTEGLFGGPEGAFLSESGAQGQPGRYRADLKEARLDGEVNLPLKWFGVSQLLTVGGEIAHESLDDPGSTRVLIHPSTGASLDPDSLAGRTGRNDMSYTSYAVFVESNIAVSDDLILTPSLRLNEHEKFGFNASPGISASYALNPAWTIKGGVARAYKTPNLYQANPNYLLYSQGIGCRTDAAPCFLQGNEDLDSETSVNKEIGIAYDAGGRLSASATYFHNDYKDKIVAGVTPIGQVASGPRNPYVLQWENTPEAVVSGVEGNLLIALSDALDWNTNLTYMIESEDKTYGQPLSVIPKYTVNTTLDWQATDKLSVSAQVTWYGKQEPATFDIRRGEEISDSGGKLGAYSLVGLNAGYKFDKTFSLRVGVSNLFDKKIHRSGLNSGTSNVLVRGAGARTYNEHGRAFFASLTASF